MAKRKKKQVTKPRRKSHTKKSAAPQKKPQVKARSTARKPAPPKAAARKPAPPKPAARRGITLQEYLLTILQTRTQAEAAAILGVSVSTVKRIKNADPEKPYKPEAETAKKITRTGKRVYKKARDYKPPKTKEKIKGRAKVDIPPLRVIPPVVRLSRLDPTDKKLQRRIWSDTISYNVEHLREKDIISILIYYRDKSNRYYRRRQRSAAFRLIYRVPEGKKSLGGRKYDTAGQSATEWQAFTSENYRTGEIQGLSNDYLADQVFNITKKKLKILFVLIQE